MPNRRRVTAKDIADACNVSQATVSYVLNHTAGKRISEAKRLEILQTAKEMNYVPNRSAKDMRKNHGSSIGFVCKYYYHAGFGRILNGLKDSLNTVGYTLTLLTESDTVDFHEILQQYYSNNISGVIFAAFHTEEINTTPLEENNIPFVVIDENGVRCNHFSSSKAFDNALYDCIQFCKDNNLRKIRYFTRSVNGTVLTDKYRPLTEALENVWPEAEFERIIFDTRSGVSSKTMVYDKLRDYLLTHEFDIAISSNYILGMLLQNCILTQQFSIHQNPLHICLSYSPFLERVYPSLSSIHIPYYEMGLYAAELILSIINDEPIAPKDFKCTLLHLDTTRL